MLFPVYQSPVPENANPFVPAGEDAIQQELERVAEICRRVNAVLLRDAEPPCQHGGMIELDFLVAASEADRLAAGAGALGYAEKKAFWCRPHRFFIKFDKTSGIWFKLDVVTELWLGYKTPWLRMDHLMFLRWHSESLLFYRLAAAHEFTILLLRAVLGKRKASPARIARIVELSRELEESGYSSSGSTTLNWCLKPAFSDGQLEKVLAGGNLNSSLSTRVAVGWNLFWSDATGNLKRLTWTAAARLVRLFVTAVRKKGCLVALIGPDGAGKSTAAQTLRNDPELRARIFYTGLYGKTGRTGELPSGTLARASSYLRRLARLRYTLCAAKWQKLRGRVVVLDRYVCDAWINAKPQTTFQRFRRHLLDRGWPTPDLVLLLDAPPNVLLDRKHEHTADWLEQQRHLYGSLAAKLPQMVVVDTNQDFVAVQRDIVNLVWNTRRSNL